MASLLSKRESLAWRVSLVRQLPFGGWVPPIFSDLASCILGFLQRTNSLEEKSRLVSAFRERQASKNLLSCENSDPGARFRRTETDFSNLFAQGSSSPCPTQLIQLVLILFPLKFYFFLPHMPAPSVSPHETSFRMFVWDRLLPFLLPRSLVVRNVVERYP